jgi:hypothetical protein
MHNEQCSTNTCGRPPFVWSHDDSLEWEEECVREGAGQASIQ